MNKKKDIHLDLLLKNYNEAPIEFHATCYWEKYENLISDTFNSLNINQIRSNKYPIFATFGFSEHYYYYHPHNSILKNLIKRFFRFFLPLKKRFLPYDMNLQDIRELAYFNCQLRGKLNNSKCISEIETSIFGNPGDIFKINNKLYTMSFLNYYLRYCFINKLMKINGNEIIVELGSGSGYQIEILKKFYPNLTILCFDLPHQLYLCENYLKNIFKGRNIVSSKDTVYWTDLKKIEKGKIHFFGNWKMTLLNNFEFDLFLNAASFGEMEPEIVKNYLKYIENGCKYIYLLQSRNGKKIKNPINFDDYNKMLRKHKLISEENVWNANKRLGTDSNPYFQGLWKKELS